LPAANVASGTSRVTTLPAPITARAPMRTPGRMIAPPPTQTSAPISIGFPYSSSSLVHWACGAISHLLTYASIARCFTITHLVPHAHERRQFLRIDRILDDEEAVFVSVPATSTSLCRADRSGSSVRAPE
jgi:hypothetical protein